MALTSGERSAISRALARGGAAAVRRVRYGLYRVASSGRPGTVHTVCTDRGVWRCTCAAGVAGRPACWHRAAVLIAKVEARGARVTGPATPAAPAPLPATVIPLPQRRAA
jgi:hypothetical protein